MRVPPGNDAPREAPGEAPRRSFAPRVWLMGVLVGLVILLLSLQGLARLYTDYLWFDELGLGSVWRTLLSARFTPAVIFSVAFFIVAMVNLTIADRLGPKQRVYGPNDELVERYQMVAAPYAGRIRVGVSLLLGLVLGVGVSSRWQTWLLYRNRTSFGIRDEQFDKDVSFYVFQLPFIRMLLEWLFVGLVVAFLLSALAHYLNGGIRVGSPFQKVAPQVKAHLSVLLALMALTKAVQYWYSRYELVFSSRGPVDGASYTDVTAQLPAYNFLVLISVTAAALFIANIWRRGWTLPVVAVGLWAFISVVVGTALPYYVQRFQVQANQRSKEQPYIERNIAATREALGLGEVQTIPYEFQPEVSAATIAANKDSLANARLWDPEPLKAIYQQNESPAAYYRFDDLDVDRYRIGAEETQPVLIATRDLDRDQIPNRTWVNQHLAYTHGYGAVVTAANRATSADQPAQLLSGVPPSGSADLELDQPAIYFGDGLSGFTIVGTKESEIQPDADGGESDFNYDGTGGVRASSSLRKAALALRFSDWNLFISGRVTSDSKVLYIRDVRERVQTAAPFLTFDDDPYPVILDRKVVWIVDAYTTTSRYPNAQRVDGAGGLAGGFNYVRNSVKAVVDAYNGDVTFYVVDDTDPLIQTYQKAFPEMFTPGSEAPEGLVAHYRYPEDLFTVQSNEWGRYHVDNADSFFSGEGRWSVASDSVPLLPVATGSTPTTAASSSDGGRGTNQPDQGVPVDPLYLAMRLPGEEQQEFVLSRPYSPFRKNLQLASFLVARMDGENYGQLMTYSLADASRALSPAGASNEIETNEEIARAFTQLRQRGSDVIKGNLQLIPVQSGDETSVVYMQPIYVEDTQTSVPRLRKIAMVGNERSVLADSVDDALEQLFGVVRPVDPIDPTDPVDPTEEPDTVADLLDKARAAEAKADEILKERGLEGLDEASRLQAEALDFYRRAAVLSSEAEGATDPDDPAADEGTDSESTAEA